jgi:hypothetical protein
VERIHNPRFCIFKPFQTSIRNVFVRLSEIELISSAPEQMIRLLAALLVLSATLVDAYKVPAGAPALLHARTRQTARFGTVVMEDIDLASTATAAIDNIMAMCPDDVDPPTAAMADLKSAVSSGDTMEIGNKMYLLLIEQCLNYDIMDGKMQKTVVDYSNLEDEEVMKKMTYIYTYGISMFKKGLVAEDALKDAVLNRLAAKVGKDGPGFDQWLAIPAVQ